MVHLFWEQPIYPLERDPIVLKSVALWQGAPFQDHYVEASILDRRRSKVRNANISVLVASKRSMWLGLDLEYSSVGWQKTLYKRNPWSSAFEFLIILETINQIFPYLQLWMCPIYSVYLGIKEGPHLKPSIMGLW